MIRITEVKQVQHNQLAVIINNKNGGVILPVPLNTTNWLQGNNDLFPPCYGREREYFG